MKPDFGVGLQHTVNVLKSLLGRAAKGQAHISAMHEEHNGIERNIILRIVVSDRYNGGYWSPVEDPYSQPPLPPYVKELKFGIGGKVELGELGGSEELAKEIEEYIEND